MTTRPILIAGAGPVGLVAAAALVKRGLPVIVLESGPTISTEMRASTFHAPTLDMLDELGAAAEMVRQGRVGPRLQYRRRDHSLIAEFDFGVLADVTRHPFRLQCEQFKLTRILHDLLTGNPLYDIRFNATLAGAEDQSDRVEATLESGERVTGSHLIGCDGAHSATRRAASIAFEGFTWPERFLVLSTEFDFASVIPGLADVSYYADPEEWFFLLRVPGVWRAMFPVRGDIPDEATLTEEFGRARFRHVGIGRDDLPVTHRTLYRVHQRVAETFRRGRILLAGDAAHINNPLGGMGLNGGIHDAINLCTKLAEGGDLDQYDRQRRGITVEHVQRQTILNKQNLEAATPEAQADFQSRMAEAAADPARAHDFLLGASMIKSLRRAEEIA